MCLCGVVLLFIVCVHQAHSSEEYITGYSGQSVVLKSGANSSWSLQKVQWSVYVNTTFIAGLKEGEVILYGFWRYQGRLDINNTTGDLTIHNVRMDDGSVTYTVAVVTVDGKRTQSKVNLTVQERLKTPEVQNKMHSLQNSQCHAALECTASGQSVKLSWTPDEEFEGSYISGIQNSSLVLFTSFSAKRNVTFNCTASSGEQTMTRQITVGCSEEKQCEVCTVCSSCTSSVILTFFLTVIIYSALIYAWTQHKDKITACYESARDFIQSKRKTQSFSPGSSVVQAKKDTV